MDLQSNLLQSKITMNPDSYITNVKENYDTEYHLLLIVSQNKTCCILYHNNSEKVKSINTFSSSLGVFINVYTRSLLSENFALSLSNRYPLVSSVVKKLMTDIPR